MPLRTPVHGPVELDNHPADAQVRPSKKPALLIANGLVHDGLRQSTVEQNQPQPGLHRRLRTVHREVEVGCGRPDT